MESSLYVKASTPLAYDGRDLMPFLPLVRSHRLSPYF